MNLADLAPPRSLQTSWIVFQSVLTSFRGLTWIDSNWLISSLGILSFPFLAASLVIPFFQRHTPIRLVFLLNINENIELCPREFLIFWAPEEYLRQGFACFLVWSRASPLLTFWIPPSESNPLWGRSMHNGLAFSKLPDVFWIGPYECPSLPAFCFLTRSLALMLLLFRIGTFWIHILKEPGTHFNLKFRFSFCSLLHISPAFSANKYAHAITPLPIVTIGKCPVYWINGRLHTTLW